MTRDQAFGWPLYRRNWRLFVAFFLIVVLAISWSVLAVANLAASPEAPSQPRPLRDSLLVTVAPYPLVTGGPAPAVTAESFLVADFASGVVLAERESQKKVFPASLTKLVTALVALDYFPLDDSLVVTTLEKNGEEAEMGLEVGDSVPVENLLYGLLVSSGADVAYTLADNYPGSIENFVYAMNEKAKELNMNNTHFSNPSGFDEPDHYSTAHDWFLLSKEILTQPLLAAIVATPGTVLGDSTGTKQYPVRNVNQLLGVVAGVDGIKTGYTDYAGQCLILSAKRGDHRIIVVVLKSQDRFADSVALLEWGFANVTWQEPPAPV